MDYLSQPFSENHPIREHLDVAASVIPCHWHVDDVRIARASALAPRADGVIWAPETALKLEFKSDWRIGSITHPFSPGPVALFG